MRFFLFRAGSILFVLYKPIMHTDPNDHIPTPQLTNYNFLTSLQGRQRAPLKLSRRCLENHTRTGSSMSETQDEKDDYGSSGLAANPNTHTDCACSTPEKYSLG